MIAIFLATSTAMASEAPLQPEAVAQVVERSHGFEPVALSETWRPQAADASLKPG